MSNTSLFPVGAFMKSVTVGEGGTIFFIHQKQTFRAQDDALNNLKGLTVLVEADGNVTRSSAKLCRVTFSH